MRKSGGSRNRGRLRRTSSRQRPFVCRRPRRNLFALDAATGKQFWKLKLGNVGRSSPVVTTDGVIYVGAFEEQSHFWIIRDAGDKPDPMDHKQFPRTPRASTRCSARPRSPTVGCISRPATRSIASARKT
jgi:hypothetical protein